MGCSVNRSTEIATGVAGLVLFLWLGGQHGYAAVIGLGAAVVYVAMILVFPLVKCGRCGGSGKILNPAGSGHRACGKCQRKGEHVRLGRRVWDRRVK